MEPKIISIATIIIIKTQSKRILKSNNKSNKKATKTRKIQYKATKVTAIIIIIITIIIVNWTNNKQFSVKDYSKASNSTEISAKAHTLSSEVQ